MGIQQIFESKLFGSIGSTVSGSHFGRLGVRSGKKVVVLLAGTLLTSSRVVSEHVLVAAGPEQFRNISVE